jgi:hypothetical protein
MNPMRNLVATLLVLIGTSASSCVLADAAAFGNGEGIAPGRAASAEVALPAPRSPQLSAQPVDVQLWVDGRQEIFQRGDPLRLRFRTSRDAYVAILHIDPEGELEFLFPYGPRDENYVRGLRTYSLPDDSWNPYWRVNSRSGIGYFYIIASAEPLDFQRFQRGSRWDLSSVGSRVRGDPFWVLDQLTHALVASPRYAAHGVDYYSYHVGSRSAYPSFACYDGLGWRERGSWGAYYGSCDRVRLLLRSHPNYYDSRRYQGDRRVYWREIEAAQPLHGFKEPADLPGRPSGGVPARAADPPLGNQLDGRAAPPPVRPRATTPRADPDRPQERAEPARPERQRPTLERRSPEQTRERAREQSPERPAPPPPSEPRRDPPARSQSEPRREERRPPERPREGPPPAEPPASIVRQPGA